MGQSGAKLKLSNGAQNILTPITIAMPDEYLSIIILEYVGQGTIAWIALFLHDYSDGHKATSKRKHKVNKKKYTSALKIKQENKNNGKLIDMTQKILSNMIQNIKEKKSNFIKQTLDIKQVELNQKKLLLEIVIGFYGDCNALTWLHSINYTSYDKWHTMWCLSSQQNPTAKVVPDLCKLIYLQDTSTKHQNINRTRKNIALLNFINNDNLEGVKWCKDIGTINTVHEWFNSDLTFEIKLKPGISLQEYHSSDPTYTFLCNWFGSLRDKYIASNKK